MDHEQSRAERPSAAERPQESGAAVLGRGGRMSRQRKRDAVLRLLRGADLELVSRSLGVTAATLSGWRDAFLAGPVRNDPIPAARSAGRRGSEVKVRTLQ